ncbi:hypothetical protein Clacol_008360 [Clathrus columnatus]|uniref:Uncharacterized protein n=1 Tax=Clathrus columnatus TaxID=1419009 RepID=A0AAV5AKT2_9AGAM|nr:hypothetical protein Clacol_008360 [Clathrus columnatus]
MGSSRGLGKAIALAFARQGVKGLVVNSRQQSSSESLVEKLFESCKEHFGCPITTVVNNALADFSFNGDARSKLDTILWQEFDKQLRAALHGMRECGFGRIINIGSNLVQNPVVPYHDYTAYVENLPNQIQDVVVDLSDHILSAKGALLAFTHTAAAELGPYNITVNLVSGGLLKTTDASASTPEAVFKTVENATPLRKSTTPEEMADAILFFASPWSRAVTGQSICVDGGLVMS